METYARYHLSALVLFVIAVCLTALMYNVVFMHRMLSSNTELKYVPLKDRLSQSAVKLRWMSAASSENRVFEQVLMESPSASSRDGDDIHVAFVTKFAYKRMKILRNMVRCLGSILKKTESKLHFHVLLDAPSRKRVGRTLQKISGEAKKKFQTTYHDVEVLSQKFNSTIKVMRKYFFTKDVGRYNDDIFFISELFHRIFHVDKIIMLDLDIKFFSNIADLNAEFGMFDTGQIIGIAHDQQPQYRHDFASYRKSHPGTNVGSPSPGKQGFNTGVVLFNLERMRRSVLYNTLLRESSIAELCKKYDFKGYLGHQDFFTLAGMEYPEIFYVLDCSWNRQLDTGWNKTSGTMIFNQYHSCNKSVRVYHGNGEAFIPDR